MVRMISALSIALWCLVLACSVSAAPLAQEKYVTVKDGHLNYDGRRLKLWGVNFCYMIHPTADLELTFDRLAFCGFNAVRVNYTENLVLGTGPVEKIHVVPETVKGSNTAIDRLDRCIYLAKQRGMFFWHGFSMYKPFTPADYDALPDDGTREEWNAMIKERGVPFLVYIDDRAEKVFQKYAENFLNHVNPYTGKRWADEEAIGLYEIFNEDGFIDEVLAGEIGGIAGKRLQARWNEWLIKAYKTEARLTKAWGKLEPGESLREKTVRFAPLMNCKVRDLGANQHDFIAEGTGDQSYSQKRSEDVMRFVYDLYLGFHQRFVKHLRAQGKPGMGISVVPIAFTGRYGESVACYYGAAQGDFVSVGNYGFSTRPEGTGMPDSVARSNPHYPHIVRLNRPPALETPNDVTRVKGKPYLIYETNDYKPNPYFIEFPFRMLAQAVWNDMDGVFWFYWDDPGFTPNLKTDADYVNCPIQMPDLSHASASLILVSDEVGLSAIKTAGTIFRNGGLPPAPSPLTATIGKDLLLNLTNHQLDPIRELLRAIAWRSGVQLVYDLNKTTSIPPRPKMEPGHVKTGPYMTFDWRNGKGTFRIDSPTVKLQVGFNGPDVNFTGKVSFKDINHPFSSVALVASDGKRFTESREILLTLLSKGQPTGFVFDPSKMKSAWARGIGLATINRGTAPNQIDRVGATISAPWLKGRWIQKFDFERHCYEQGPITENQLTITPNEPLFFAKILQQPPQARVKKILVIGNSISRHGPNGNLGWNGNYGMAASSQEKDYVHQVYAKICQVQPQFKPELRITRPADESKMIGGEAYLDYEPDLVIVQLGDNFRGKANVEELQKPYEKILAALKEKSNPAIFCLSTWGNPQFDPLIREAAKNQGAVYVDISSLSGNSANRAAAEKRFTNGGVNWHPGDQGMQAIAEILWARLKEQFKWQRVTEKAVGS